MIPGEEYIESFRQDLDRFEGGIETLSASQKRSLKQWIVSARSFLDTVLKKNIELHKLSNIAAHVNAGFLLEDILEEVYKEFHEIIPYNRIGFSLIENNGRSVRAYWARTDQPIVRLGKDYSADLRGSSLEKIIATGRPRILNDLPEYLRLKPDSESTQLMIEEGMRSSLTCPLIVGGNPVGFLFFSSILPDAYSDVHISTFQQIATQLSISLEKGKLISELASQKKKIERQNVELKRLNDLKNTFLGIAAHDLRNPLANIKMIAELLTSDENPLTVGENLELLSEIHEQTEYMLTLLNDILDVTQIESGKLELLIQQIPARDFLEDVIKRQDRLAEYKHTHVVLEQVAAGHISADKLRLRQVLDNLISNAIKFSPEKTTVRVHATHLDTAWHFDVTDQGPGISKKDRQRLFTDFGRLSAKPTAGEKSTGLGLAICKRIVAAHGGKIGVESRPGQGSTFWFTLPDME
jgi:signal transduction histidine kinase